MLDKVNWQGKKKWRKTREACLDAEPHCRTRRALSCGAPRPPCVQPARAAPACSPQEQSSPGQAPTVSAALCPCACGASSAPATLRRLCPWTNWRSSPARKVTSDFILLLMYKSIAANFWHNQIYPEKHWKPPSEKASKITEGRSGRSLLSKSPKCYPLWLWTAFLESKPNLPFLNQFMLQSCFIQKLSMTAWLLR